MLQQEGGLVSEMGLRTIDISAIKRQMRNTRSLWNKPLTDDVWVTKDGRQLKPQDFETEHLVHTIQFLERRCTQTKLNLGLEGVSPQEMATEIFPIYKKLKEELEIRLGQRKRQQAVERRRIELE